jgi:hypothetical protein
MSEEATVTRYERTGEHRQPVTGELFEAKLSSFPMLCEEEVEGARWILRQIDPANQPALTEELKQRPTTNAIEVDFEWCIKTLQTRFPLEPERIAIYKEAIRCARVVEAIARYVEFRENNVKGQAACSDLRKILDGEGI